MRSKLLFSWMLMLLFVLKFILILILVCALQVQVYSLVENCFVQIEIFWGFGSMLFPLEYQIICSLPKLTLHLTEPRRQHWITSINWLRVLWTWSWSLYHFPTIFVVLYYNNWKLVKLPLHWTEPQWTSREVSWPERSSLMLNRTPATVLQQSMTT